MVSQHVEGRVLGGPRASRPAGTSAPMICDTLRSISARNRQGDAIIHLFINRTCQLGSLLFIVKDE